MSARPARVAGELYICEVCSGVMAVPCSKIRNFLLAALIITMYCVPGARAAVGGQCSHAGETETDCPLAGWAKLTCPYEQEDCCNCPDGMLIETDPWTPGPTGSQVCTKRCYFCPNEGEMTRNQKNKLYNGNSAPTYMFDEDYPASTHCFDG